VWDFDKLSDVDALAMDVDGVLTDGTFMWSTSGAEFKSFSFEDVMGLSRARTAGLALGMISGEDSVLVDRLADKVGIAGVYKGCKDKGAALRHFSKSHGIALHRIAFIGDDVNDIPALKIAGFSFAPANAQPSVKSAVDLVLDRRGGNGAVRLLIEMILSARLTKKT
jgi:3-deoxy-D-manno-octulosonate 8-phosphate phosphatase (KDO 8-P phosphatase)